MKRILTVIALLAPTLAFAQGQSIASGSLIGGVITLVVLFLLFLALREVVMWYWKINIIIENQAQQIKTQQETNNLLSEQITLMKCYYKLDQESISTKEPIDLSKPED
jgi:hypothetical protein